MKKVKRKKVTSKKRVVVGGAAGRASKPAAVETNAAAPGAENGAKLSFNHAMIYSTDVERSVRFYRDMLGFKLIEDFRHEGKPVYARMRAPGGDGTVALHLAASPAAVASDGVRLYFEVRELDTFCGSLQKNFYITQMPRMMPWGWRHAYLNDPDGHEISLYWAGENRMKKTVMKAAAKAARA
jgi:catechol 2,3-dioxygenase-like lactoylglutathione lyase family enzyme